MTAEEAIKRIQDHMDVHRIGEYPHIKLSEALNMAISALREQEEQENRKPLSAFLAPMDRYKGLKRKFLVFKSDTGEMIRNCFVLRPDKDPAAVAALRAYAEATDNEMLSADIIIWVGTERNDPLTLDELRKMDGEPVWDNFLMEWCIVMMDLCAGKGAVRYFDGGFNQLSEKRFYRSKPKE